MASKIKLNSVIKRAIAYSLLLHLAFALILITPFFFLPKIEINWVTLSPTIRSGKEASGHTLSKILAPTQAPTARPVLTTSKSTPIASSSSAKEINLEEAYVAAVIQEIERQKQYPLIAKQLGQEGRVVLRFKVNRNGEVLSSEIVSESKFRTLNESAEMLVASKKFTPIPESLGRSDWEFTVPIEYRLQ